MGLAILYPQTSKYQPLMDDKMNIVEEDSAYAKRMQGTFLPGWLDEVLREWLYRHNNSIEKYAFLEFERFLFTPVVLRLDQIPGREAFDDETFCDNFCNIEERAKDPHDWLAQYMLREGTWNTPIILLDNCSGQHRFPDGKPLKNPIHLLEGHRRLSFLNGLKRIGKVKSKHKVWIVRIEPKRKW